MAKEKKTAGQPTKYREEHCKQIVAFFDVAPWETKNRKRVYKRMPTLEGFAKVIGICISTLDNWVNDKHASFQPEFLAAYKKALLFRKQWLIDVGLSGLAPANSFKFVAVNLTDMRDKQETVHDVSEGLKGLMKELDGKTKGLPEC